MSLAAESSDVSIESLENMKQGVDYTIVAANGATTQNELIFPQNTLYAGDEITKTNGMTIVYELFTDGYNIYCDRKVYK